jgi:predicted dinucleotide-binding enzyme
MRIGILGSGEVGRALGKGFIKHGHEVMLSGRDLEKKELKEWLKETARAQAGTYADAAKFGEVIILTVRGSIVNEVIKLAGPQNLSRKTVIDTTNPIADKPPVNGVLVYLTGPNESLGEQIQAAIPAAKVVKAFNSVGSPLMVNPEFSQGTPTMFLCGDDAAAKAQVSGILREFGWEPLDCGNITSSRAIEPLCMLWCIPGFLNNQWRHAFKLLTK